jgi:pyruvate,water dikinase
LKEALARFGSALELQACTRMLFQGVNAQLTALAERAGEPDAAGSLMSGSAATDEAAVAGDLWLLANDRLSMATFLSRHGFHGPNSGDIAARSWREDAGSLERLLAAVRNCEPPAERQARAAADRAAVTARVLSALPPGRRALGRSLLRLAPLTTRSLERTKTSFMIAIDAGRAAVRAAGAELVSAGTLDDPDDGFHLFAYELLEPGRRDLRALVAERRALRERYLGLELPETWEGQPEPRLRAAPARPDVARVTGLGASPGRVEGRVRVVLDAADEIDVDVGDVLVCPTTDPSWLALMTVASALVIDIGAAASHGAIVARELGVPCVIGTRTGTLDLRDGDHVRVDGSAGVVEVLSRAPALNAGS